MAAYYPTVKEVYEEVGGCVVRRPKGKTLYRITGYVWHNIWARGYPCLAMENLETGEVYAFTLSKRTMDMLVIERPATPPKAVPPPGHKPKKYRGTHR